MAQYGGGSGYRRHGVSIGSASGVEKQRLAKRQSAAAASGGAA